jgi:hypothetical protein
VSAQACAWMYRYSPVQYNTFCRGQYGKWNRLYSSNAGERFYKLKFSDTLWAFYACWFSYITFFKNCKVLDIQCMLVIDFNRYLTPKMSSNKSRGVVCCSIRTRSSEYHLNSLML